MTRSVSLLALLLLIASACAPAERVARAPEPVAALPEVPAKTGPLDLQLTYPQPGAPKPQADSTFVFGTVGTGEATLAINDIEIPLAPNGAFLAYLPMPDDGQYQFEARAGEEVARTTFEYDRPATVDDVQPLSRPLTGTVISGRDTLAAGSEIVAGSETPGGDRRWFFPIGARLVVTGELPAHYRVQLTERTTAWVHKNTVQLGEPVGARRTQRVGMPSLASEERWVDVRIPANYAPFDVAPEEKRVGITLYRRSAPEDETTTLDNDSLIAGIQWRSSSPDSTHLSLDLHAPLWGFKAFYDRTGALVVRLRRPPELDSTDPLRGLRVLVDAGHPPAGTRGPTGYLEPAANLAIALRVRDKLVARGAEVVMTRTSTAPPENATWAPDDLWARVDMAVRQDVDALISIHNNAFPDGTNPFENMGSEVYYYHPFAQELARALVDEIAGVTGIPNLGAKQRSLALVRPTWMPAVLTESLFMMFPQQEAALKDPAFLDRLADAHVRGLEAFVRTRVR